MSFSSQPSRKKKIVLQEPQKDSCSQSSIQPKYNNAEEKKLLLSFREKISNLFLTDKKAAEKSAFVLAKWLNGNNRKKD